MINPYDDSFFMREALEEAQQAFEKKEVPIGAVLVANNQIISRAHNQSEMLCDPTAHAEMIAITSACNSLGAKFLEECTLYVTLEPCPMCAGALRWSRVGKIVYGASDEKGGFLNFSPDVLHKKTKLISGIEEHKCQDLMQTFFKEKR